MQSQRDTEGGTLPDLDLDPSRETGRPAKSK